MLHTTYFDDGIPPSFFVCFGFGIIFKEVKALRFQKPICLNFLSHFKLDSFFWYGSGIMITFWSHSLKRSDLKLILIEVLMHNHELFIYFYLYVSKCWDELFYVNCLWISYHCHEEMVRLVHTIFWIFHYLHSPFKWIWTFIHYFPSISCYLCIKSRWKDEVIGINCLLNFQ